MSENPRLASLLDALRRSAGFLEAVKHYEYSGPMTLPHEIAGKSLIRAARLVQAIIHLLEAGMAWGAEPVVRTLVELTFNVAWVGVNEERARRFRDYGLQRADQWLEAAKQYGFALPPDLEKWVVDFLAQRGPKGPKFPSAERRATEISLQGKRFTFSGMPRTYNAYRRLSAAVHADYWHIAMVEGEEKALVLDAQDAAAATSFLVMIAMETLGLGSGVEDIVRDLRAVFTESLRPAAIPKT